MFGDFVRLLQLQQELQTDRLPGNQGYMDRFERDGVCFRGIKYWPLPSQRKFHSSGARFKGLSAPIGSGKSQLNVKN